MIVRCIVIIVILFCSNAYSAMPAAPLVAQEAVEGTAAAMFECSICSETRPITDAVTICDDTDHRLCRECLKGMINASIDIYMPYENTVTGWDLLLAGIEFKVKEITCPICRSESPHEDRFSIMRIKNELFNELFDDETNINEIIRGLIHSIETQSEQYAAIHVNNVLRVLSGKNPEGAGFHERTVAANMQRDLATKEFLKESITRLGRSGFRTDLDLTQKADRIYFASVLLLYLDPLRSIVSSGEIYTRIMNNLVNEYFPIPKPKPRFTVTELLSMMPTMRDDAFKIQAILDAEVTAADEESIALSLNLSVEQFRFMRAVLPILQMVQVHGDHAFAILAKVPGELLDSKIQQVGMANVDPEIRDTVAATLGINRDELMFAKIMMVFYREAQNFNAIHAAEQLIIRQILRIKNGNNISEERGILRSKRLFGKTLVNIGYQIDLNTEDGPYQIRLGITREDYHKLFRAYFPVWAE